MTGTKVAVVNLEKIVQRSTRNTRYLQEWEKSDEMKALQAELAKRKKDLSDYRTSIGNAPLYTQVERIQFWRLGGEEVDGDAVAKLERQ